jgi:acetyl/propionyl-CoA carboxylase alpha subunit
MKPIKRIFVANRGEICRRIALTANRLGIETVMISDRRLLPEFLAPVISDFLYVENVTARTYLDMDGMIAAAKELAADAVHPGYGFLSENANFARAVLNAGMTWVGPNPDAIEKMASKARAREIATVAKVPCLPALEGIDVTKEPRLAEKLKAFAAEHGFPLLVKAAFGGGGKGMRMVHSADELLNAAERAASEAVNAFGNGLLIVEPYVTAPRHVEVQVLGDRHGQVWAVGDRDCSVQRRHQKIIEEAPAPGLTAKTREAMAAAAIEVSRRVGYDSAGTVEFLVDWSPKSRNAELQKFYFLEMNTRLQVEHPVTEEVHGLDLVEAQIRVAEGAVLSSMCMRPKPEGHSIEIRVYAEDCENNFLPSPGQIHYFRPFQEKGLRWELGVDRVDEVSPNFDPMIAKLVATGKDRSHALDLLIQAIEKTALIGPKHNLTYLREIFRRTSFREGAVTTGFISENQAEILAGIKREFDTLAVDYTPILPQIPRLSRSGGSSTQVATSAISARTMAIFGSASSRPEVGGGTAEIGHCGVFVKNGATTVNGQLWTRVGSASRKAVHFAYTAGLDGTYVAISDLSHSFEHLERRQTIAAANVRANGTDLNAPVPGKVVAILVQPGVQVEEGQTVFVLESMKMEFEVKASRAGKLKEILVAERQQVDSGTTLAAWEK